MDEQNRPPETNDPSSEATQQIHDQGTEVTQRIRLRRRPPLALSLALVAVAASIAALVVALVRSPAESAEPVAEQAVPVAETHGTEPDGTETVVPDRDEDEDEAEAVYRKAAAGVVEIRSPRGRDVFPDLPFEPEPAEPEAQGTGFVIDEEGHIVTNEHVVGDARSVTVVFADGEQATARVVGADPSSDIALLEVDPSEAELEPLELGSSADLSVGQDVYALSNPYGLDRTLTAGIVSALDRTIRAPNGYTISGVIQTDAALNSGSSGGPLLDDQGRVVGVAAQIATRTGGNVGIGYAIPIDLVKEVVEELQSDGQVEHAYLGVVIRPAGPGTEGAVVTEVRAGSPADAAGLQPGDVVTAVDGEPVRSPDDLTTAVGEREPGDEIELEIERDGSQRTVTATLASRPEST